MSLLFVDSFDHYDVITNKWDFGGLDATIRTGPGQPRTGIGCLQINSAALGPTKVFAHITDILCATAWYSDQDGGIFQIGNDSEGNISNAGLVNATCNPDRSVSIVRGPSGGSQVLGTSAPGVITFNTYNTVAVRTTISATATVRLWVNGVLVLTLVGVDTRNGNQPLALYANEFQLAAPGGIPTCFHDDVYVFDCGTAPNDDFPGGAPRVYAAVPFADSAPLAWTPLGGGAHFSEVNEIPPDDDASYVSSAVIGQQDQYEYNPTGVPAGAQILAVQHNLDMKVDAGARSVGSLVEGIAAASDFALTNGYHDYTTPWDINPATGLPWDGADFPASFGPEVTA